MQTRKRAKSVTFGKTEEKKQEVHMLEEKQQKPVKEEKEVSTEETSVLEPKEENSWGTVLPNNQATTEEYQPEDESPEPVESSPAPEIEQVPETVTTESSKDKEGEGEEEKKEEKHSVDDQWPFPSKEKKKHGLFTYFLLVALVAFLLGFAFIAGGYYALHGKNLSLSSLSNRINSLIAKPTPTPKPTLAPAATPSPTIDLSQYTISVLNGSGVSGQAAKVKDTLTTAGYKVTTTGNADKSNYTTTQIAAKKSVSSEFTDSLKATLKKSYVVDVIQAPSSQSSDVVVTIGTVTSQ